jgi:hypothetical protein
MGGRDPSESVVAIVGIAQKRSTFSESVAFMIKKLMGCPAWLGLSEDRASFVFIPDRAKIVQRIFELSIAGFWRLHNRETT